MEYRAEVDGVRAVAVLSVILFHAGVSGFGGGFVGVDVFFVISGYLITGIIIREVAEGRFSFGRFYLRRARRILPALFFVLAATVPFAWLWLLPDDFREYAQSLLAATLSYANIHFWTKTGYFAPNMENAPLLHTWSLAVEEQFYFIVPVLAVVIWRWWGKPGLLRVLSVIGIVSFVLSQSISENFPTSNFFLLPSRMWELLAGSLLSFVSIKPSGIKADVLAGAGLLMVLASIGLYGDSTPFPSVYALLPVFGTVLLLGFAVQGTYAARLLTLAPIVFCGRISYSAYLWHQPLFVFARIRCEGDLGQGAMMALSAVSLMLAYLSWRFIEQPFRHPAGPTVKSDRYFVIAVASCGAALAAFAIVGNAVTKGFPFRISPEILAFQKSTEWHKQCLFQQSQPFPQFPLGRCTYNDANAKSFAIWGDSVASSISDELAVSLDREKLALKQLTHGYCAPVEGVMRHDESNASDCVRFNDAVMTELLEAAPVSTVILSGAWEQFFEATSFTIDGQVRSFSEGADRSEISRHLDKTIAKLEAAGKTVILLYAHPLPKFDVTEVLMGRMLRGSVANVELSRPLADYEAEVAPIKAYLDAAGSAKTIRVYPSRELCDGNIHGVCLFSVDGKPLISDRVHFTRFGAKYVVDAIMETLHMRGDGKEPKLPFAQMRFVSPSP